MGLDLSIVIPAFNEVRRLPSTLHVLQTELPRIDLERWEIVVSDDGSTDGTPELIEQQPDTDRVRVVSAQMNRGKGAALLRGIRASRFDTVLLVDADLPVTTRTIQGMVQRAQEVDLVIGSRRISGASVDPPQPVARRAGGFVFRKAVNGLGFDVASDPQCGVKVLRTGRMAAVLDSMCCNGFGFDVELIERSRRVGLRAVEVPVTWSHVEGSSLRPIRDALITLRELKALRSRLRAADGTKLPTNDAQGHISVGVRD